MHMREFRDRVAVVTGAGSGIGRSLALRCAREQMQVVVADKDRGALSETARELRVSGTEVLAVPTDVSRADDVEALAAATFSTFGTAHLLCNNAGVGIATPILQGTIEDWEWALGVNLWGVIHGIRAFVPAMQAQQAPCHIVNTASIAGLISPPGLGIYRTTKHAVVAFSEALYHELSVEAPHIGVSVLCPGLVKTGILSSAYRPVTWMSRDAHIPGDSAEIARLQHSLDDGMAANDVADLVFEAVQTGRFYILTHLERNWQIEGRMQDILLGRNPTGRTMP